MKHLLLAALLTVGVVAPAWAQQPLPVDSTTHKITYSAVVQVPGASQAELYGRALRWLAKQPVSPPDQRTTDAASGTLAARVGVPFAVQIPMLKMPATVWREVVVQVKDGKAKYELSNFFCQPYAPTPGQPSSPTQAQLKLTPLESYLDKSDWHNYTKDGQPRVITSGFIQAAQEQSEAEIKTLISALQEKADW